MLHLAYKCKEPEYLYLYRDSNSQRPPFVKELGCNGFQISDGWLHRWKKKNKRFFQNCIRYTL